MNIENILKVADAIEQHSIPDLGFNMADFVQLGSDSQDRFGTACGTVACIAGWAKRLRTGVPISPVSYSSFDWRAEAVWLGLDEDAGNTLFFGDEPTNDRLDEVAPEEAVAVLRNLAATGKVDWPAPAPTAEEQKP